MPHLCLTCKRAARTNERACLPHNRLVSSLLARASRTTTRRTQGSGLRACSDCFIIFNIPRYWSPSAECDKRRCILFRVQPNPTLPPLPSPLTPSSIYFLVEAAWLFWLQHSGLLYLLVRATMGPRVRNTKGSFWGPISPICQEEPLMGHLRCLVGALEGCNRSPTYESLQWMNLTIVAWNKKKVTAKLKVLETSPMV